MCLGNHIDLTDMIGSFASSANASMVAKNRIKDISTSKLFCPSPKIKTLLKWPSKVDLRF